MNIKAKEKWKLATSVFSNYMYSGMEYTFLILLLLKTYFYDRRENSAVL